MFRCSGHSQFAILNSQFPRATVAQLVEHRTENAGVAGSSPACGTTSGRAKPTLVGLARFFLCGKCSHECSHSPQKLLIPERDLPASPRWIGQQFPTLRVGCSSQPRVLYVYGLACPLMPIVAIAVSEPLAVDPTQSTMVPTGKHCGTGATLQHRVAATQVGIRPHWRTSATAA